MNPNHIKSISIATLITLSTVTAQAITTTESSISSMMSIKESLPSSPIIETITTLYIATFGRTPSSEELNYWVDDSGLSVEDIAKSFFDQSEAQRMYPDGTSNIEFVNSVYQNLFNKFADRDGLIYWTSALDAGRVSRDVFILAVINGAQGADKELLDKKTEASMEYNLYIEENGLKYDKIYAARYMKVYIEEGEGVAVELFGLFKKIDALLEDKDYAEYFKKNPDKWIEVKNCTDWDAAKSKAKNYVSPAAPPVNPKPNPGPILP